MTDTSVKNIVNDCTQILDDDAFVLLALQSQMRSKVATLLQNDGVSLDEISLKTGIDLQKQRIPNMPKSLLQELHLSSIWNK